MYLKRVFFEACGPISSLSIELPFEGGVFPKPVVLVGENGSGKTNFLSYVADALFEAAAVHYQDVFQGTGNNSRPWFRIIGASTIQFGKEGSLALLHFQDEADSFIYKQKGGTIEANEIKERLPEVFRDTANWGDVGSVKEMSISDKRAGDIFEDGAYVYFPSSRAELPDWLNRKSLPLPEIDFDQKLSKHYDKQIFVERAIEKFGQWIHGVITDSRAELSTKINENTGHTNFFVRDDNFRFMQSKNALDLANKVLANILNLPDAEFIWFGRGAGSKLGIRAGGAVRALGLNGLSGGQATLLGIFGTLLRYADSPKWAGGLPAEQITGICLIDEIDAHMHVDLQYRALPELIKFFPRVQFIVSSHSPLFALGMNKVFPEGRFNIYDMPSGIPIQAEAYSEFGRALEVLQATNAFARALEKATNLPGKLLVLLEGETDPKYFKTAAAQMGQGLILDMVEFEWVGAKDPKSGQGFHTGKDALNQTLSVLRANPNLVKRPVLLLYDNDTNKAAQDFGNIFVRSMPANAENKVVEAGVENLLPEDAIENADFDVNEKRKPNGDSTTTRRLNKMRLCNRICEQDYTSVSLAGFSGILSDIRRLAEQYKT